MSINVYGASFATSPSMKTALARATGVPVTLYGDAGKTIDVWSRRVPAAGSLVGKTVAVLELGGNGVPSAAKVREVDAKLHATNASQVVWFAFTDWPHPGETRDHRIATSHVVAANVRNFVALPTPPLGALNGPSYVHMTAAGYTALGQQMAHGLAIGNAHAEVAHGGIPPLGVAAMLVSLGVTGWIFWKIAR